MGGTARPSSLGPNTHRTHAASLVARARASDAGRRHVHIFLQFHILCFGQVAGTFIQHPRVDVGRNGGDGWHCWHQVETSLAVLSIATFQMLLMFVMLILAGRFERRHSQVLSMHHEQKNRERHGPASRRWVLFVNGILVLLLAPLVSVVVASFQVRTIGLQARPANGR